MDRNKILNIYLDVDGVLKGCASPKKDIERFLEFCLNNCVVYWLTTYCRGGVNYAPWVLSEEFDEELIGRMNKSVNQTDWIGSKVETIDFNTSFVWFDDNLFESEKCVLEAYYVTDGFFRMGPRDPEMARKTLSYLRGLE